jgi:biopolymer transport protein ExbD
MLFPRKKKHTIPELNTTSTADISFMLLIFFLVTTSMDSDKGLGRQLPPVNPDKQEYMQDIDRSKVLTLRLMADGQLTIDDHPIPIDDALRKELRHFIIAQGSEHIIELQISRNADYDTYFHLQNQIVRAYGELHQAAALKKYGKDYTACDEEQRALILKHYPQRIQETVDPS